MKERPIILKAHEVRAALDGRQTQFRRVVKPQPQLNGRWMEWRNGKGVLITEQCSNWSPFDTGFRRAVSEHPYFCPYGQPGDRIWVKETWQKAGGASGYWWYRSTDSEADDGGSPVSQWRSSIHMPRHASRITLEITSIRVERLQDITEADAMAEGVDAGKYAGLERAAARAYSDLWESIHGPGSWEANPWVWVVEFNKVKP